MQCGVSVTNLCVIILHAEQELLQFLQQKGETFVETHSHKRAHELLKMQLCWAVHCMRAAWSEREDAVIIYHQNWQEEGD